MQAIVEGGWNNPRYLCFEESDADGEASTDTDQPLYTEERPLKVAVTVFG